METTPWINMPEKKKAKQEIMDLNKLARVAGMMDEYLREENAKLVATLVRRTYVLDYYMDRADEYERMNKILLERMAEMQAIIDGDVEL